MEDIDFLKTNTKVSSKSSNSDVDLTKPEKEGKPKKKKPQKTKKKKEDKPEKNKEEKKGFFSGLFKSKKKEEKPKANRTEGPEMQEPDEPEEPEVLPPLKLEEKDALDKIISEETKPLEPSPLIPEKPRPVPTPEPKPIPRPVPKPAPVPLAPELEQTVEKIKNGEIPLEAIDVNLIPKEMLQELKPEKKLINLLWIGLATSLILMVIYAGVFYLQSFYLKQAQINQEKVEALEDDIIAYKPLQEEIIDYNQKIEDINKLLKRHIYWNVFFQLLEENILPTVKLTSMSGGITEPFTIVAEAPDFKTVTSQIEVFEQAKSFIKNVEVNSATATPSEDGQAGTVTFTATITVEPGIFIRDKE
ncbi:hypothetical protein KKC88_03315 [Patescibacteria group bacterium]|nr:hypothetical protein [Patescibacteria group bacterium]MBU1673012.1 hypothetical protein [Patescibacteria group bacterium]MBU1964171.1 hypothetical protein [Patescibacteria group bacterium]